MPTLRELCRRDAQWRRLIAFAWSEGWQVMRTPDGRLWFTKEGLPPVVTGPAVAPSPTSPPTTRLTANALPGARAHG